MMMIAKPILVSKQEVQVKVEVLSCDSCPLVRGRCALGLQKLVVSSLLWITGRLLLGLLIDEGFLVFIVAASFRT